MISIVIMMMKLVTTFNRLLIWVSLRMCESDERALPTDKSTPDSLEGQKLHRILRHRHTDTDNSTRDSLVGQSLHIFHRHRQDTEHRHKRRHRQEYSRFLRRPETSQNPQTQKRLLEIPQTVGFSTDSTDTDTRKQTQTQTRILQIPQRVSNKNRDGHFCSARYKMISQFTWPNFHGGNAEEGTRSLWLYSCSEEPPIPCSCVLV